MLFVELALIRWTGSNVLHLSYFSNFVLLGSFLGIGIGFLRADRERDLFPFALPALAVLVAFVRFFPVEIEGAGGDLIFFGTLETSGPPREVVLAVVFVVVAATMAFIAEGVARAFVRFEPLEAYRLDIIGSIAGIVGFTAMSFLRAPPLAWGVVAGVVLLVAHRPRITVLQIGALVALLVILGFETFAAGASWSPYYKVTVDEEPAPFVRVNGVPHQAIFETDENSLYSRVYRSARPASLDNVLIVGAGTGNDVATALEQGAGHVDAVEIDPRLHQLGTELHPDKPYADPRVDVHIDDGRAFLERSDERYDLILFALPDSITLVSGQSSLRLESYLFTREAMESARDHLGPDGVFAMYNYYVEQWLIDRLAGTLEEVYDRPPCVDASEGLGRLSFLFASEDPGSVRCATAASASASVGSAPEPATDDHPFPYLRERTLPVFYLVTIGLILLVSVVAVRAASGPLGHMASYADLFFMGAAFLLLETKNVVQFALLFGTTWVVNALVFAGVLLSVLAAVEVSRRVSFKRPARLYLVLLAALVVSFAVPSERLLSLPIGLRFVAAVVLAFTPIFLANLVFTQRFKDVGSSASAFGANLLGAMVGGLLEYGALVVGYRMLLVLVAVLYGLAFALGRRHLTGLSVPASA